MILEIYTGWLLCISAIVAIGGTLGFKIDLRQKEFHLPAGIGVPALIAFYIGSMIIQPLDGTMPTWMKAVTMLSFAALCTIIVGIVSALFFEYLFNPLARWYTEKNKILRRS